MKEISNFSNNPVVDTRFIELRNRDDLDNLGSNEANYIIRGNGHSYSDCALNNICTLSTLNLNQIEYFNVVSGEIICDAGLTIADLLNHIVPNGYFPIVTPGTKNVTIGAAVACDVHGKNNHKGLSFCSTVQWIEVFTPAQGFVVCNRYNNQDLFYATCGGMGLTGIITKVCFRLQRITSPYIRTFKIKCNDINELLDNFESYSKINYSMAWIDLQNQKHLGRSILFAGDFIENKNFNFNDLKTKSQREIKLPFYFPNWAINHHSINIFNKLYYLLNKNKSDFIQHYDKFFYPLDLISNFNRFYGRNGFLQYQFLIPKDNKDGFIKILKIIANSKLCCALGCLKLCSTPERFTGLLSYPKAGYSLAIDLPYTDQTVAFTHLLDKYVIENRGRIYLAKNGETLSEDFRKMYSEDTIKTFKEIKRRYDPNNKLSSLLSMRLGLS
ncbi:MAG: FAD-binding oxidoreductase [Succinivibrio sp.]|nr:FAD-binding oxidoreductase [Succinivibrio sp.]